MDEPDIYLHSDLQRQLVHILQEIGPNIIIATHSTEIISEVEPDALLNVNKRFRSAKRVKNSHELQSVFSVLGSNLNPTLTQLAKTKRAVFVEGKDFLLFARFARKLGVSAVANRSHFAVVSVGGFNAQKVKDFSAGMELTLGVKLAKIAIFDRDYRSEAEAKSIVAALNKVCWHSVVHTHKEIENYVLRPAAISRAIEKKLLERGERLAEEFSESGIEALLMRLTDALKNKVLSQLVTSRQMFEKKSHPAAHPSNASEAAMNEFDSEWGCFGKRMKLVSGKEVLSLLNLHLQSSGQSALTPFAIVEAMRRDEVPGEMVSLISKIDERALRRSTMRTNLTS